MIIVDLKEGRKLHGEEGEQTVSAVIAPKAVSPKLKRGSKKWVYGTIAAAVVLGGGALAYAHAVNRVTPVPSGDIYKVQFGSVTESVSASGTVQVPTEVALNFNGTGGVLSTIPVQIGQQVHSGQVVATLNDAAQRLQAATAEAAVQTAQGNIIQAQAKLAQARQGATPAAIAVAQATVSKAQAALNGAKIQYQDQLALYNDRTSAQQQVVSAQNAVVEQSAAVKAAQINVQKALLQQQETQNGGTPQDISALQFDVSAAQQATNNENQQLALAQSNLSILQQSLQNAEQTLTTDTQNNASSAQIQADESAVRQAQQSYNSGQSAVVQNQTAETSDESALVSAEKALADAQPAQNTNAAQLARNAVAVAQAQLVEAQVQYNAAKANLSISQAIYNDRTAAKQALNSAANNVQQNQAALQGAIASLQEVKQPPVAASIEGAQAAVFTAQAGLQSAEASLQSAQLSESNTVLTSPISGVVTAVNGAPGETVSAAGPTVIIDQISPSNLTLNMQVPESEIGSVKPGDAITATVSAYPNQNFVGKVSQVYPTPQVVSNVTEYTVMSSIDNSSGNLKPGMSTNVLIDTQTANHVVTVPAISLVQFGSIQGVYVVGKPTKSGAFKGRFGKGRGHGAFGGGTGGAGGAGGAGGFRFGNGGGFGPKTPYGNQVYFQPVQIGLFGSSTVQITSGLQAGEEILLIPPAAGSGQAGSGGGFGGGAGGAGGGFGGGGAGGGRGGGLLGKL